MTLLYSNCINEETHEYEIKNQIEAQELGWEEHDIEPDYTGAKWYEVGYAPEQPAPTEEEQRQKRSRAYQQEVDPITSHIQRLKDEEQTEEIIAEIEELKTERAEKVAEIKERYPYPVGSTEE